MLKCFSISLGCPKNRVDTEKALGSVPELSLVLEMEQADFIFINTCGFIEPAVKESVRTIAQTIQDIKEFPRRPVLIVAGCLIGRYGEETLASELPEVDMWLDNRQIELWPSLLAQILGFQPISNCKRVLSTPSSYAWLKISDGCRHKCTFCTIPYIRGAHYSFSIDKIRAEALSLLDQGVKELVLVAQDLTAWGQDINLKLPSLLDELAPLPGLARLRLMYMYPTGLTDEFLCYLKELGAPFVPYFDVPLQHAHSDILSRMGRPFAQNPYHVVERIRKHFPQAALRTSLITGFPGETEEHFECLREFVEEVKFAQLGVFAYEAEDGTLAATMPEQVPTKIKQARRNIIMALQKEISAEYLEQYVGESLEVLVDAPHEEWPGLYTGRAWFQAPEFDGLVYVSGENVCSGSLIQAQVVDSKDYDLSALA